LISINITIIIIKRKGISIKLKKNMEIKGMKRSMTNLTIAVSIVITNKRKQLKKKILDKIGEVKEKVTLTITLKNKSMPLSMTNFKKIQLVFTIRKIN